jgi:hypothetical protein
MMILNEFGAIAHKEWEKLPARWPHIELGAFQIMPNHMHGILLVRAPLHSRRGCPHIGHTPTSDTVRQPATLRNFSPFTSPQNLADTPASALIPYVG